VLEPTCGSTENGNKPSSMRGSDAALDRASRIFRALGDVPRLRLMSLLSQGKTCVTALAEAENESISTISQRLRVLRNEHLVTRHRRGKHIDYVLADHHVMALVSNVLAHATEVPKASLIDENLQLNSRRKK
jgi:ArsR family transcriptional regulator